MTFVMPITLPQMFRDLTSTVRSGGNATNLMFLCNGARNVITLRASTPAPGETGGE
jgi:hypothetical protein